jgi:hypothetical protein
MGKLKETIQLSEHRHSYASELGYQLFDTEDQPLPGQSCTGRVVRRHIRVEF